LKVISEPNGTTNIIIEDVVIASTVAYTEGVHTISSMGPPVPAIVAMYRIDVAFLGGPMIPIIALLLFLLEVTSAISTVVFWERVLWSP